jgi:hypothetical protein
MSVGAKRHSVICAVLWVVFDATLAVLPDVLVLEVEAPIEPLVEDVPVDPAFVLVSLLATEELLVDGVVLPGAPAVEDVEVELAPRELAADDEEVSLAATEALVDAVEVLLVADGEELLMPELAAVVSLLATEELLVDGVLLLVLLARPLLVLAVDEVEALDGEEVLAWLLASLLAKPVEVEPVEEVEAGEAAELLLLAKPADDPVLEVELEELADGEDAEFALDWSLLAIPVDEPVEAVDVDDVAEGDEAELVLDWSLLARPVEDPLEDVEVEDVADGDEAELLLEDGELLVDPAIFTFVF